MPEIHIWAPSFAAFGGGVTAFNRELALALGHEHPVRLVGKHDTARAWKGLPLAGSGAIGSWGRTTHFSARALALAISQRPALVIAGHSNFGPLAHALRHFRGIAVAVVAYGMEIGSQLSRARLRALRSTDAVWAISRWTRARLVEQGVSEATIALVPVTFAEDRFDLGARRQELRARYAIGAHEKVILTVARLDASEAYKGYERVLSALPAVLRSVGPVKYLVVGEGSDSARLSGLVEAMGLSHEVTLCGFVSDDELPDHYRLADAFAMPSTGEGFGIAFLEAMACGIPVLGGDKDGTIDALADGELGLLVDPCSVEAISEGLTRLLERKGPDLWFDRSRLRARCIALHGRATFRNRLRQTLQPLLPPATMRR